MSGSSASDFQESGGVTRGADWYNSQYDPRLPDRPMPEIIDDWMDRTRQSGLRSESLSYGGTERERVDLYRPEQPKGVLIFYHGGYWRSCSKDEHGWIARAFVDARYSVAMMNYPLCPEASLPEISQRVRQAFVHLYSHCLMAEERQHIIVAGHSAGGYLAAVHRTTEWASMGLPVQPVSSIVTISGLFDLTPLAHTLMNAWLQLDDSLASQLSLNDKPPQFNVPTELFVGANETAEFHRQSRDLAASWPLTNYQSVPGGDHFSVLDELAEGGSIAESILDLFGRIVPGPY